MNPFTIICDFVEHWIVRPLFFREPKRRESLREVVEEHFTENEEYVRTPDMPGPLGYSGLTAGSTSYTWTTAVTSGFTVSLQDTPHGLEWQMVPKKTMPTNEHN